ncbi:MAG: autotransporter outer membrane beta-barrel domain-containing protein, partial [Planctomycetes bacterium]|nr:autotransporter outer membrane beta-barrel domain-containing protein [Planctomycetota bacterium]
TYSDNDIRDFRDVGNYQAWTSADYHTDTSLLGANLGFELQHRGFTFTPTLGLTLIRAKANDHDVSIGAMPTQRMRGVKNHATVIPVEINAEYDLRLSDASQLTFETTAGYAYNFNGGGLDGSVVYHGVYNNDLIASARIRSRDNSHHSYRLGGGLRYENNSFDLGVRYDYTGKSGYTGHRLTATLGYSF